MNTTQSIKSYESVRDKRDIEEETEKAMASHSSTLAWKTPWMEEPARLQSMGSLGVGEDRKSVV